MVLNFLRQAVRRGSTLIQMAKPNVVFVLGGPGAGKGTQCANIVKEFGYVHLSAGDLLRQERARKESEVGQLIERYIKEGQIVPVHITCGLLEKAMQENQADGKNIFLVDGFPRNKDNLDGWQKQMGEKANVKFVLFFDCPDEVCIARCLKRGADEKKKGVGSRSDDNEESLKKRMRTYHESTRPIIDYYKDQDCVRTIDANRPTDQIFEDVKKVFS